MLADVQQELVKKIDYYRTLPVVCRVVVLCTSLLPVVCTRMIGRCFCTQLKIHPILNAIENNPSAKGLKAFKILARTKCILLENLKKSPREFASSVFGDP